MTTRIRFAPAALATLGAICALGLVPSSAGATVTATLRVLTPDQVLDPGTTYIVDEGVTVPTRPDADCFGPPGGSGAEFTYDKPNALSLLATAGRTTKSVAPLALTDQFGFGLGVCGIGGVQATDTSFWYLKSNHEEATVGADQLEIHDGDQVLYYLSPNNFPNPNPAELELQAPARALAGQPFGVTVVEHKCVTQSDPPFATTCTSGPAAGVAVAGGDAPATTGVDGTAQLTVGAPGEAQIGATRGADIPSEVLDTCIGAQLDDCAKARGERLVGSPQGDKISGTKGDDEIRSRGGDDRIDARQGGADVINCGRGKDKVKIKRKLATETNVKGSCEKVRRK